jgi:hypothetical protein
MAWLERLTDLRWAGNELSRHRQNRQNPRFVSFGSPVDAQIPPGGGGADPEVAREAFEERAAIMEYDGGWPREEAERQATMLAKPNPDPARWRGTGLDLGDLRPCIWCGNFARSGRCLSAARGELRAARDYEPATPGKTHRCIGYLPPPDDPDQRPGYERWPDLVESQKRLKE